MVVSAGLKDIQPLSGERSDLEQALAGRMEGEALVRPTIADVLDDSRLVLGPHPSGAGRLRHEQHDSQPVVAVCAPGEVDALVPLSRAMAQLSAVLFLTCFIVRN
ncbi:hypothetical protein ACFVU3_36130 [Streptomyces sp. NPDC058052]|uniref:hypothetical protein n=1 Tax=Streptomyces sp. NPDC058052 TaxID=3346316 RepID=UPI0036E903D8